MSQYPSPYYPPQPPPTYGYSYAMPDLLAPARRSSIVMFILGALGLVCGGLSMVFGAVMTPENIAASPNAAQIQQQLQQFETQTGGLPIHTFMLAMGILLLLPSVLYLVMGIIVRRGGKGGVIVSLVLSILTGLFLLLQLASAFFVHVDFASLVFGFILMLVPLAGCAILTMWLIEAMRAAPAVAAMRQHWQSQYWQAQQHQQYYGQPGYGYGWNANAPPAPAAENPMGQSHLGQGSGYLSNAGFSLAPPPPPPPPPPAQPQSETSDHADAQTNAPGASAENPERPPSRSE